MKKEVVYVKNCPKELKQRIPVAKQRAGILGLEK